MDNNDGIICTKRRVITVRSQKELDAIPDDFMGNIYIESKETVVVRKKYIGMVVVRDNSTVVAYGNSRVKSRGNSKVVAYDNSYVEAWDHSHVGAWDNSTVVAYGNSDVNAWNNSNVTARNNSRVWAYDESIVEAFGNSCVESHENSTVNKHGSNNDYIHNYNGSKISVKSAGIEICGTKERLEELVNCISFENETPSSALADLVSELEMALDMK